MQPHVALIGNLFFDHVWNLGRWPERGCMNVARSVQDSLGGIASVARTLRLLDPSLQVDLHSVVGDDTEGFAARELLLREGFPVRRIATVRGERTSAATILVDLERLERTTLLAEGACMHEPIDLDLEATWCHFAYLDTLVGVEQTDLIRLRERGATISADLCRPELDANARERVFDLLTAVDYLIVSDIECRALRGATASDAVRALGRWVREWTIVQGPEGSIASDGMAIRTSPVEIDRASMSVFGAGDAFAAGFIHGMLHGSSVDGAIDAAHEVARDTMKLRA